MTITDNSSTHMTTPTFVPPMISLTLFAIVIGGIIGWLAASYREAKRHAAELAELKAELLADSEPHEFVDHARAFGLVKDSEGTALEGRDDVWS